MFLVRPTGAPAQDIAQASSPELTIWWDLLSPTDDEIVRAEALGGRHVPRREELEEIESSSRQYQRDGAIYLSMPLMRRNDDGSIGDIYPVGIVLAPDRLLTVRYTDYRSFDSLGAQVEERHEGQSVPELGLALFEIVVNRMADILERVDDTLSTRSRAIFKAARETKSGRAAMSGRMRASLRELGRSADLASGVRDSLLSVERATRFLGDSVLFGDDDALRTRLDLLKRDVDSLTDFVGHTLTKVQFLLDATLGFINIDQNDNMKVLTVISAIGIPPTLIAGIYGMNFHTMPELEWHYGYVYSLVLMLISAIAPLFVFWRLGWIGRR